MSTVSNDPIADMLARIRNANAVNKTDISLPYSSIKEAVAKVLVKTNFIISVTTDGKGTTKQLNLALSTEDSSPKITAIKRLSKPGRRIYASSKEIPWVKQGRGIVIISTAKGIMSGSEAKTKKVGGELICEVY
ncbi:MAG: 30S ribosomal protein S8 [Candidatus Saccharimonadales bacterium]